MTDYKKVVDEFEKQFPGIADFFQKKVIERVMLSLPTYCKIRGRGWGKMEKVVKPFEVLVLENCFWDDKVDTEFLKILESGLESIKEIPFKSRDLKYYKKLSKYDITNDFYNRLNELEVYNWLFLKGKILEIEAKLNPKCKKSLDFQVEVGGQIIYGEIFSSAIKDHVFSQYQLKVEIDRLIKDRFGQKFFAKVDIRKKPPGLKQGEMGKDQIRNFIQELDVFFDNENQLEIPIARCFTNHAIIKWHLSKKKMNNTYSFPYPPATPEYDLWIEIIDRKPLTDMLYAPSEEKLIAKIITNLKEKQFGVKKGKINIFPEIANNIFIIYLGRGSDEMWKLGGSAGINESFFSCLNDSIVEKKEKVLDPKISGYIIRGLYWDSKIDGLSAFHRFYENPNTVNKMPESIQSILCEGN